MINFFVESDPSLKIGEYQTMLDEKLKYCTPFNPDFKYMATCFNKEDGGVRILVKGAPEKIDASH